jgi:anaerobic magnesium-protoporphyrin IX monomethyl ester cyclase
MRILLANTPYIEIKGKYGVKAGARWPAIRSRIRGMQYFPFPFFMAYAASLLKSEGFHAELKDFIAEEVTLDQSIKSIINFIPEILVLETSTPSIYSDLDVAKEIKLKINSKIVLVGPHASALPEELIRNNFIDYIIPFEYEYTLLDLVKCMSGSNFSPQSIKGVYYSENGSSHFTGKRELIEDLDLLPYPERDDVPLIKYTDPSCKGFPNISIIASRGCPNQCIFCVEPSLFYGKPNFRKRKPEKVVDEIEFIIDKYKPEEIYFDDSSFTLSKKLSASISREIINRNMKIKWSCMADVSVDYDTMKIMKESGCEGLKFGVESVDPKILENTQKNISIGQVEVFVQNCKKLGLYTHGTFMFGLPGETRQSIQKTTDFALSLDLTSCQFSVATPYPGTKFYELAKKEGWLTTEDFRKFEGSCTPVISYPECKPEDIIEGINNASRKKIKKLLKNPKVLVLYIFKIYRIHGPLKLILDLVNKFMYIMKLKRA